MMGTKSTAFRAGLARGWIEFRQSFTNGADLWSHFFWPILMLVVVYFVKDVSFGVSGFFLGTLALPSILGMNAAFGMISMSQQLTVDREDGTLLRAKATPNGMIGYLIGKIFSVSASLVVDLAIFLIPGMFLVPGLVVNDAQSWLTLIWVLLLGMVATLPIGAVLGSAFSSARAQQLLMLPIIALIGISGIFYPLATFPAWLQWIAQSFPVYWMGLGMRSALLPAGAESVEIGESWRHLETVAVLGAWAVLGLILAPILLRRMARRESGSSIIKRREKALQRVG
jgi:ABC-2 type transport system permease protein